VNDITSEYLRFVIARCGGYFKPSLIEGLMNPNNFLRYLKRQDELFIVLKRWHSEGEYIYRLPSKYVKPYWKYNPKKVDEPHLFKSFALIKHYEKAHLLPYTKGLMTKHFPNVPTRTFNGICHSLDTIKQRHVVIILDYLSSAKRVSKIVSTLKNRIEPDKSPDFHVVTPTDGKKIRAQVQKDNPKELVRYFSFPELVKIF